jgi:hypothetical protein
MMQCARHSQYVDRADTQDRGSRQGVMEGAVVMPLAEEVVMDSLACAHARRSKGKTHLRRARLMEIAICTP